LVDRNPIAEGLTATVFLLDATERGLMSARQSVSQKPLPSRKNPMDAGPEHHSKARFRFGMPRARRNGRKSCPKVVPPPSSSGR